MPLSTASSTQSMVLALNLGSATLKAAHYHYLDADDGRPVRPHGDRFEVGIERGESGNGDPAALLERVAAMVPGDALPPDVVAHRIVHGGPRSAPAVLADEEMAELLELAPLAPLHQLAALRLVTAARALWPDARQVAVFDTAWHASLADWSRRLPVPQALHDAGVMRYGFHGLAFQSAMRQLAVADSSIGLQRVVLAHLGSGCSLCAVDSGRSIDTTMGLTPLDGLPMATRSGSLDPGVVFFLQRKLKLSTDDVEQLLWHESGLLGVSGESGDMRKLLASHEQSSRLAVALFVIRVAQGIAAMVTSLGGIDALVFSGGIGSHAPPIRQAIVERLEWAGLKISRESNVAGSSRMDTSNSRAKIWMVTVDEELELADAAMAQIRRLKAR